eukprot:24427-Hanusia_phi.AAC.1
MERNGGRRVKRAAGVRMWLNGRLLVDRWSHGAEPRGAEVTMGSWMNEIEIEYRQVRGARERRDSEEGSGEGTDRIRGRRRRGESSVCAQGGRRALSNSLPQMWGPSQVTLEWKGEAETGGGGEGREAGREREEKGKKTAGLTERGAGSAWEVVAGHRVYQEEEAFIFSIEVL